LLLDDASDPGEGLSGELWHPRRRSRREAHQDVVEVGADHDLRFRLGPAAPLLGFEVGEERLAKPLEGPAEGHRKKERPQHIALLDPQGRTQLDPQP